MIKKLLFIFFAANIFAQDQATTQEKPDVIKLAIEKNIDFELIKKILDSNKNIQKKDLDTYRWKADFILDKQRENKITNNIASNFYGFIFPITLLFAISGINTTGIPLFNNQYTKLQKFLSTFISVGGAILNLGLIYILSSDHQFKSGFNFYSLSFALSLIRVYASINVNDLPLNFLLTSLGSGFLSHFLPKWGNKNYDNAYKVKELLENYKSEQL